MKIKKQSNRTLDETIMFRVLLCQNIQCLRPKKKIKLIVKIGVCYFYGARF